MVANNEKNMTSQRIHIVKEMRFQRVNIGLNN